jgi:hypothetical protein
LRDSNGSPSFTFLNTRKVNEGEERKAKEKEEMS